MPDGFEVERENVMPMESAASSSSSTYKDPRAFSVKSRTLAADDF